MTPVHNGARWIADTITSVLRQTAVRSGRVRLDYLIADGGSSDGTVEIARHIGGDQVTVISRSDNGPYEALANAWTLREPGASVVSYLNAGDAWFDTALEVVLDVMETTGTQWVCGQHVLLNAAGQPTFVRLPFRYRRSLIRCGAYGRRLPHIQQESTFWSNELMSTVDLDVLANTRLAGDHYLWHCFARRTEPTVVEALLGSFRAHPGQLSEDRGRYLGETRMWSSEATLPRRLLARFDSVLWHCPPRMKKAMNPRRLLRFDHAEQEWR